MATRQARNTKQAKPTVVDIEDAKEVNRESAFKRWQDSTQELFGAYEVPSEKRVICGFVACAIIGAGIGYVGGLLLETIVAGAVLLSGSMFLGLLIYCIGIALLIYGSMKAGAHTMVYVTSGKIDEHATAIANKARGAWTRVSGFFSRNDTITA